MSQAEKAARAADRDVKLQVLHHGLVEGVRALVQSDQWTGMLAMAARLHSYSWRNCLLIIQQKPDATHVAGYRTWQSLGRQVRRGERGIAVLAPVTYRRDDREADEAGETQHPSDVDKASLRQLRGWKIEHVFDVSQTDGDPVPEVRPALVQGQAPAGAWDALARQITADGFELLREVDARSPGAIGSTDFATREVRVRPDVSPAQALKTLIHERAHILLEHRPGDCADPRSRREVEAESVAYVVCQALGVDCSGYSVVYVGGWAPAGHEEEEVAACAGRVVTAARDILDRMPSELLSV
jgi:antirestriction protein ArdC